MFTFAKALPALALLGASGLNMPANTESGIPAWLHPEVVRVDCIGSAGSAFRVGPKLLLSVAHVTSAGGCSINGEPITVLDTRGDFAILRVPTQSKSWLRIDCNGFVAGHSYTAIGFARALDTQTTVDIVSTGDRIGGFARLRGVFNVIPGQSGGPIVDPETGKVVGTVNVYNAERGDSGSTELRGTSVCRGAA